MIHWKEILLWSYLCGVLNDFCVLIYFSRFGEVLAIITVKKKKDEVCIIHYLLFQIPSAPGLLGALASAH